MGADFEFPVDLPAGPFQIEASAAPAAGPAVKSLGLIFDGETIDRFQSTNGSRSYTPAAAGDHVVEAFAFDDVGVIGDSIPVFVRIAPARGKVFQRLADGDWNDAGRWLDRQGISGVPGPNDMAIVGSFNVSVSQNVTALAVGLHGGSITGSGALTITGTFTVAKGTVSVPNLTIESSGTLLFVNEEDVVLGGTVTNLGTTKVLGRAGITGIRNGTGANAADTPIGRASARMGSLTVP